MTMKGPGIYFDGASTARHDVTVEVTPTLLRVVGHNGIVFAEWPYDEIEALSAPENVLRVGKKRNPVLARLEVRDPQLAAAIDELSLPVDRTGLTERRGRKKVIGWALGATASLLLVAIYGVPEAATRLAPHIPYAIENRIGDVVEKQVRRTFDTGGSRGAFECGNAPGERQARAAFDKLVGQLERAAALPTPLRVFVVRRSEANAMALPGGHVYVFQGLIDKANNSDELAGVIAHEIGHVSHRDGTRAVLQGAGLSLLFGLLLGDFVGGGAVILAAKTLLQTRYSRDVEAAADRYGVQLMNKIGGDPHALGTILMRIAGSSHSSMKILLDHPETNDRIAVINATARPGVLKPLLENSEWAELKRICQRS